ncbi:MAG: hypothetical protein A2539_05590 [Elusimicrobia bacterium RIFOXYD2_FULL_34_15]|nr:MAG: hypothetical protein A2539_05590 [Elusimicrobia bacterium RIFOXYD2_FULL_34_15]
MDNEMSLMMEKRIEKASHLHLRVFTSSPKTFQVTSTLIYGNKNLVLIDAQFTLSEAHRLVNMIKATGKNLTMVYITHGHPDHYWGLNVIKDAFPNAKFVSMPEVIEVINKLQPVKLAQWKPVFGDDIPSSPIIPEPLEGNTFELEGNIFVIVKGQGDVEGSTFVWIPSLKTIVAGDIVYGNVNVWMLETDKISRKKWIETIDQIAEFNPDIVIGGHTELSSSCVPNSLYFTKYYITAFDKIVESAKSTDEVILKIKEKFPQLNGLDEVLQMSAKAFFPGKDSKLLPAIGHIYQANFGDVIFHLNFESETKMTYTMIKGPMKGTYETVNITVKQIRQEVFMIYWQEDDMTTVVHVEDFEKGIVYANITQTNGTFINLEGSLKILQ